MSGVDHATRPRLILIGAPGAGKTTVGQQLAERHGLSFRDTDQDVEISTGRSIADIFIQDGEPAFRAHERSAVALALAEHDGVLALGGGAVLDITTQSLLIGHTVVFLDVGLTAACERTGLNQSRPLLAINPRATIKAMLDERRPLYESLATEVVATDGRSIDDVVEAVDKLL